MKRDCQINGLTDWWMFKVINLWIVWLKMDIGLNEWIDSFKDGWMGKLTEWMGRFIVGLMAILINGEMKMIRYGCLDSLTDW